MRAPREGVDFATYRAVDGDRGSGWNWYCMHCVSEAGRGWRWNRVDARRNARGHAGDCSARSANTGQAKCEV